MHVRVCVCVCREGENGGVTREKRRWNKGQRSEMFGWVISFPPVSAEVNSGGSLHASLAANVHFVNGGLCLYGRSELGLSHAQACVPLSVCV